MKLCVPGRNTPSVAELPGFGFYWDQVELDSDTMDGTLRKVIELNHSILNGDVLNFEEFLDFYQVDPALYAPEAQAEVIHLRKGSVDEWRDCFTAAQSKRAWDQIPAALAAEFGWSP